jgi:hypothetical protein
MEKTDLKDMVRGDSYGMTLNFKDVDENPIDIQNRTFTFTLKTHWSIPDANALVQKVEAIPAVDAPGAAGTLFISLTGAETSLAPGKYVYDIQMENSGLTTTILLGSITVVGDITRGA